MDIETRVRRRRDGGRREGLIDLEALSPVAHVPEPSGRGPTLERLLDHLDPALDGRLPPNAYVYGPFGAGKSAVVRALFDHLAGLSTASGGVVQTTTRGRTPPSKSRRPRRGFNRRVRLPDACPGAGRSGGSACSS